MLCLMQAGEAAAGTLPERKKHHVHTADGDVAQASSDLMEQGALYQAAETATVQQAMRLADAGKKLADKPRSKQYDLGGYRNLGAGAVRLFDSKSIAQAEKAIQKARLEQSKLKTKARKGKARRKVVKHSRTVKGRYPRPKNKISNLAIIFMADVAVLIAILVIYFAVSISSPALLTALLATWIILLIAAVIMAIFIALSYNPYVLW